MLLIQEEWIKKIKDLLIAHKEGIIEQLMYPVILYQTIDSIIPPLQYTTIEIFYGAKPAVRINGDISTELMMHLSSSTNGKTIQDDRGW